MTAPFAGCPNCGAPLISTLDFPGAEFYCLECGRKCGFLSPHPLEATPEVEAQHSALQAEWDEHVGRRLLFHNGWLHDCEKCKPHAEPHSEHATDEEWAAHRKAALWLEHRAKLCTT
jgi:hypothetical protein